VHGHAALRERQRHATGADPELERRPAGGELGEQVGGRRDDGGLELLADGLVVPTRRPLAEVVEGHGGYPERFSLP
jgi:hypothetical protein